MSQDQILPPEQQQQPQQPQQQLQQQQQQPYNPQPRHRHQSYLQDPTLNNEVIPRGPPINYNKETSVPFCDSFYTCDKIKDPTHTSKCMHPCYAGRSCNMLNDPNHTNYWYHFNLPDCPYSQEGGHGCPYLCDPAHRASYHHSAPQLRDYMLLCRYYNTHCNKRIDRVHTLKFQHCYPPKVPIDGVAPAFTLVEQRIFDTSNANAQQQQQQQEQQQNDSEHIGDGAAQYAQGGGKGTSIPSCIFNPSDLKPCPNFYTCHEETRASHMYFHPCPRGVDCSLLNNEAHMCSHVHFKCVPCPEGTFCTHLTDPMHRAFFSHKNQFDYLSMCKYGKECMERYDYNHRKRYQHFDVPTFPPVPTEFTTQELCAQIDDNGGVHLCNNFFACPHVTDKMHQGGCVHPCLYGIDCRCKEDPFHKVHFYHYEFPLCPQDKQCARLNDPLHRSQYHHTGLYDYMLPCEDGDKCRLKDDPEHNIVYQHIYPPIFPCIPPIPFAHLVDTGIRRGNGGGGAHRHTINNNSNNFRSSQGTFPRQQQQPQQQQQQQMMLQQQQQQQPQMLPQQQQQQQQQIPNYHPRQQQQQQQQKQREDSKGLLPMPHAQYEGKGNFNGDHYHHKHRQQQQQQQHFQPEQLMGIPGYIPVPIYPGAFGQGQQDPQIQQQQQQQQQQVGEIDGQGQPQLQTYTARFQQSLFSPMFFSQSQVYSYPPGPGGIPQMHHQNHPQIRYN